MTPINTLKSQQIIISTEIQQRIKILFEQFSTSESESIHKFNSQIDSKGNCSNFTKIRNE